MQYNSSAVGWDLQLFFERKERNTVKLKGCQVVLVGEEK
jgi:hypothetical protein